MMLWRLSMFDWIKRFFMTRWGGHCPLCGSSRVAIKIRRKMPYVVDGPTFAYYTCRTCRHTWSHPLRVGI